MLLFCVKIYGKISVCVCIYFIYFTNEYFYSFLFNPNRLARYQSRSHSGE